MNKVTTTYDLSACCCGVMCTLPYHVRDTLHVTLTVNGASRTFAVVRDGITDTWLWGGISPGSDDDWVPCEGFRIQFIQFFCDDYLTGEFPPPKRAHLAISGRNDFDTVILEFAFGTELPVVISNDPIHLTYGPDNVNGLFHGLVCNGSGDILISAEVTF